MAILWGRYSAPIYCALLALVCALLAGHWPWLWLLSSTLWLLAAVGLHDYLQSQHPVLANYPLLGHLRYFLESVRPELRQYFWESDVTSVPWSISAPSNRLRYGRLAPPKTCMPTSSTG